MSTAGSRPVMPMIQVASVDATREFYVGKLGFQHQMAVVSKDGQLDFCNLIYGGASLMFTRTGEPVPPGPRPVELYIETADVDQLCEQVRKAGVDVSEPLTDQWWGDRTFVVTDPNGYRVWFYTTVSDAVPPPGMTIV